MLALGFLGVAAAASASMALLARGRGPRPAAVLLALGALLLLTAVFDSLMIGAGLFHYDSAQLLGVTVGLAPIEDFAYPVAGALLLPALWALLRTGRGRDTEERE